MSSPSTSQPQDQEATVKSTTPTTTNSTTETTTESSTEKKPIQDLKFYPDNPTEFYHKAHFSTKQPSQFYDPCQQASKMSMSCLERNNYDKDMCLEYFKAYKECRQEWMDQRKKDRRSGFFKW